MVSIVVSIFRSDQAVIANLVVNHLPNTLSRGDIGNWNGCGDLGNGSNQVRIPDLTGVFVQIRWRYPHTRMRATNFAN